MQLPLPPLQQHSLTAAGQKGVLQCMVLVAAAVAVTEASLRMAFHAHRGAQAVLKHHTWSWDVHEDHAAGVFPSYAACSQE